MVKVTAIILASFAVAPFVFATANPTESTPTPAARSVEEPNLEARSPAPQPFGKWIRRITRNRWLKKAIPIAGMAAKFIVRDENGDLYVRDVDLSDLSERDLEELDLELDAREFEDLDDLEVREPRRKGLGRAFGKAKALAGKARRVAKYAKFVHPAGGALSLLGSREFDEDELDARDYEDLVDLLEREYEGDIDLDARDPWFGSRIWNTAKQLRNKGSGVLNTVNNANKWLGGVGLRELEDDLELEERDFDDDFELDARDPWFGSRVWNTAKRLRHQGSGVLNTVNNANKWLGGVGLRELGDEMEERSLDDLDALD